MKEIKPPQLPCTHQKRNVVIIALILAVTYKLWVPIVIGIALFFWAAILLTWLLITSMFS